MKTEIDSDLPRWNDYSAREVRKHLLSSDWGREMRSWREQLKSVRREGLLPPISLALSIAVGVIIASYVIYDQSNDRRAITINLLTEAVGIVVGGIVVALIFQLMLESRSEKRWSTARVAILQQLESHYRAIIYVARDQWRWGYWLPPLPDNAQLEESLKVFRDQLENQDS